MKASFKLPILLHCLEILLNNFELELMNHQYIFYAADVINMSAACYSLYHIIYDLSDCLSYNSF